MNKTKKHTAKNKTKRKKGGAMSVPTKHLEVKKGNKSTNPATVSVEEEPGIIPDDDDSIRDIDIEWSDSESDGESDDDFDMDQVRRGHELRSVISEPPVITQQPGTRQQNVITQQPFGERRGLVGGRRGGTKKQKIKHWKKHTAKKYSHAKNKTGYRSDCSGFISYMWNIPLTDKGGLATLRTADWFKYSKPINKKQLRSGDVILLPGKHVIMFDKWANKKHDKYWAYQMCNKKGCRGFTYMKIPYPYNFTRRPDASSFILLRRT
mgnify:CR=1 FL=1